MERRARRMMSSGMPSRVAISRPADFPGRPSCRRYVGSKVSSSKPDLAVAMLSDLIARKQDIPAPCKLRGKHVRPVVVPALAAAKVELYRELRAAHITKAELARRMRSKERRVGKEGRYRWA